MRYKILMQLVVLLIMCDVVLSFTGVIRDTTSTLNILNATHITIADTGTNISSLHVNTTNVYASFYYLTGIDLTVWMMQRFVNASWTNYTLDIEAQDWIDKNVSAINSRTVNTTTQFGGEVSGTFDNIVLGHNALDDQYYDSEGDLTALLDDDYVDVDEAGGSANISCTGNVCTINMSMVDTDTTYTADESNLTLVGTVFHLLKVDLAELDNSVSGFITDGNTNWDNSYGFAIGSSLPNLTFAQINLSTGNHSQWLGTYPDVDTDSTDDLINDTDAQFGNVKIGGGFGSTGITLEDDGDIWMDGSLFLAGNITPVNINELIVNGSIIPPINNIFTVGNSTNRYKEIFATTLNGSLTWTDLKDYPSACTSSQTPTGIGDTITCSAISITESQISDLTHINPNDLGIFNTTMASNSNDSVKSELRNNIDTNYTALNNRDNAINTSSNIYSLAPHTNRTDADITGLCYDTEAELTTLLDDDYVDVDEAGGSANVSCIGNVCSINMSLVDTDTTYTADEGNLTLVGTVFHLLKVDLAELDNSVSGFITNTVSNLVNYPLASSLPNITFTQINASIGNWSLDRTNYQLIGDYLLSTASGWTNTSTQTTTTLNVGVKTTTPSDDLVVNGTFRVVNETGTEGLYVGQNGNVGIGTTGPGSLLDVSGGDIVGSNVIRAKGDVSAGAAGVAAEMGVTGGNAFFWGVNRTNSADVPVTIGRANAAVTVNGAGIYLMQGNVGIGTTAPSHKLEVAGSMNVTNLNVSTDMHVFGNITLYNITGGTEHAGIWNNGSGICIGAC